MAIVNQHDKRSGNTYVYESVSYWVDDNFGYIRRYPDVKEQRRSGGNGLYYHSSYWAHPGMSYLFINSDTACSYEERTEEGI